MLFHLPALDLGNVTVLLQPARGYHLDETASYHDPDLVPPHGYLAAYLWLRHEFGAHAVIHNGKHGNLEWLPGKATALDITSYPAALWAELPQLYPFIVNDPGEGTQAKRRTGAVIIDHLVPPLTRAETYGPLKDLEALLDEYYAASGMDRRRLAGLRKRILDFTRDARLDRDIGLVPDETEIAAEDRHLPLRPQGSADPRRVACLRPIPDRPAGARSDRGAGAGAPRRGAGEASLIRALADDLKLGLRPADGGSGGGHGPVSELSPPARGGAPGYWHEGGGGAPSRGEKEERDFVAGPESGVWYGGRCVLGAPPPPRKMLGRAGEGVSAARLATWSSISKPWPPSSSRAVHSIPIGSPLPQFSPPSRPPSARAFAPRVPPRPPRFSPGSMESSLPRALRRAVARAARRPADRPELLLGR